MNKYQQAVIDAQWAGLGGDCPWCGAYLDTSHRSHCIVLAALAEVDAPEQVMFPEVAFRIVEAERETCATIAEDLGARNSEWLGEEIAQAIRARGGK